jgi:hypothetical protein
MLNMVVGSLQWILHQEFLFNCFFFLDYILDYLVVNVWILGEIGIGKFFLAFSCLCFEWECVWLKELRLEWRTYHFFLSAFLFIKFWQMLNPVNIFVSSAIVSCTCPTWINSNTNKINNKWGDWHSAYLALKRGSRCWECMPPPGDNTSVTQPCYRMTYGCFIPGRQCITQQTVTHTGHLPVHTATSRCQQQARTKSRLTATAGAPSWVSAPLWPHGQVPPSLPTPHIVVLWWG